MMEELIENELYEARYHFKERRSNARFFAFLLLFFAFLSAVRSYWTGNFGGVQVDGSSMNNTLVTGQQLLMKYTKDGSEAKRGDVIVIYVKHYSECEKANVEYLIKRLIAVEGDTVKCHDGQVYIQYAGESSYTKVDEPYAYYCKNKLDYDFGPYKVGEGEIFFLGDNRQNSVDSRYGITQGSHLSDRLYKAEDIFGVVPEWAIKNQKILEKIFF